MQGNGASALPVNTDLQQVANTALGAPVAWGTPPSGNVLGANVNCVTGCSASTVTSFAPTGNTLAAALTPATASVSSVALPAGGISELVSNDGTVVGYVRAFGGFPGTATANDIPIQPGAGCVLSTAITGGGTATWINAFNVLAGSSIKVASGAGLGDCPTGGGRRGEQQQRRCGETTLLPVTGSLGPITRSQ